MLHLSGKMLLSQASHDGVADIKETYSSIIPLNVCVTLVPVCNADVLQLYAVLCIKGTGLIFAHFFA